MFFVIGLIIILSSFAIIIYMCFKMVHESLGSEKPETADIDLNLNASTKDLNLSQNKDKKPAAVRDEED